MPLVKVGVVALAIMVGFARVASAQDRLPPVEVGVGLAGLMTTQYEDFFTSDFAIPSFTARITVPVTPRFSFEGAFDIGHRSGEHFRRLDGLYVFQVKQRLQSTTRGSFHAFLTYGAGGYYERFSQKEVHATLPNGTPTVTRAFQYTEWEGPAATLIGGGVQCGVAKRVSARAEAQMVSFLVIPLGVRIAGSVSIPIGR